MLLIRLSLKEKKPLLMEGVPLETRVRMFFGMVGCLHILVKIWLA
jgi:hypothetical protein